MMPANEHNKLAKTDVDHESRDAFLRDLKKIADHKEPKVPKPEREKRSPETT
jgi:hypothetical protein